MENKVLQLQNAINNKNINQAIDLVKELAKNKALVAVCEPNIVLNQDYLVLVYIESFGYIHNDPYIFNINKTTKLLDLKEDLKNVTNINVDYQHWFHELTRMTNNFDSVLSMFSSIPDKLIFHVYVTKQALLDPLRFVRKRYFQAWECTNCSAVNNATHTACSSCNLSRESDPC